MSAIRVQFTRWLYQHGRPNRLARILNRISALQFSSGKLAPRNWVTLEVSGRRSGKPVTFPLVVADHEGERYLVSMLGATSNWVANVRAAGGHAVIHHGKPENVLLTDVDPDVRAPILRRYLAVAPGARPHMAVDPQAPPADFDRVAARYPVFHVTHDPSQQTNNPASVRTGSRLLGAGLILLGTAVATVAVLGPLVSGSCAAGNVRGRRPHGADATRAREVLRLAPLVPALVWGRDESHTGEMWNSNSLTAWLLAASGHQMEPIGPPAHGRAPGWQAGLAVAGRRDASRHHRATSSG